MSALEVLRPDGTLDVSTLRALVVSSEPEYVVNSREDLLGLAELRRKQRDVEVYRELLRAARIVEWEMAHRWPAKPTPGPRGDDRPQLSPAGDNDREAWQKIYAVGRAELGDILAATDIADLSQRAFRGPTAPFDAGGSGQDAWFTPGWVFDGLGLEFDLDVAAPPGGVPWIPARRYFTEADDGLAQPWDGLVWCNPPYSAPARWCQRFAEHPDMALLIRADLSTGGPHTAIGAADAVWIPMKRLDFVDGVGERGGAITFTTVLLGRGASVVDAMQRLASRCGGVMRELVRPT